MHKPGDESSRGRGSITIRLQVDLTFHASDAIRTSLTGPMPRTNEDLARLGVVTSVLQADLSVVSPHWTSLLASLGILVKLATSIAEVMGLYMR